MRNKPLICLSLLWPILGGCSRTDSVSSTISKRIRLIFNERQAYVTLVDNLTSRDLVSRLSDRDIVMSFSDFGNSEKIAYPDPALAVDHSQSGCDPVVGDLALYISRGEIWQHFTKIHQLIRMI